MNIPSENDGFEKVHPIYLVLESSLKERLRLDASGARKSVKPAGGAPAVSIEAKYEALAEGLAEGLLELDGRGRIVFANQAALMMFGGRREELLGRFYTDVLFLEDESGAPVAAKDQPIYQALYLGRRSGTRPIDRYFVSRLDGGKFRAAIFANPLAVGRETVGALVILRDIAKGESSDKPEMEFASLASRQLRSPLSAINWYVELLLERGASKLAPTERYYFNEVYRGGKKMGRLVSELLNSSRLESGDFAVEPRLIEVAPLIRQIIEDKAKQIKNKKIKLAAKFLPMKKINLDARLFRTIVENLLSNAVKYSLTDGRVEIVSGARRAGSELGGRIIPEESFFISIKDSGLGIPDGRKDRIFTKFFRADNAMAADADGTGLGLYNAKMIIEYARGMIWFESKENKGATFYATMPMLGMEPSPGSKRLE